jgi:antitoxin component of MazEF toxin-antitoxin module
MIINVKKFGNSNGIIIPKSILDEMSVSTGAKFEVKVSADSMTLKPIKNLREGWAEACKMLANHPSYEDLWPDVFEDDAIFDLPE